MKKLFLLAVVLGLLMSGCATEKMVWTKDNFSEEEFKKDNYPCVQESRTQWSGGGSGLIGLAMIAGAQSSAQAQANKFYKMCMESKGYTEVSGLMKQREKENRETPNAGFTGIKSSLIDEHKPIVLGLVDGSPAALAGMRLHDLVIERDGKPVKCLGDLKSMGKLKAGDHVTYKVDRNGEILIFELVAVPLTSLQK